MNDVKEISIPDIFSEDEITETDIGIYKTTCPDCGLQGGRTEGFILFSESNMSFCQESQKHFSLLETYALKKKIINCIDGREKGEKKGVLIGELFTQTLDELKEEFGEEKYEEILNKVGLKKSIELPNNGKLISTFAGEVAKRIKREDILFYRSDTKQIIEIGKIKHPNGDIEYDGFVDITPNRFVTLVERYFKPWNKIFTSKGEMSVNRSMSASVANISLVSDNFRDAMPVINRIFTFQIPILYEGKLTFPVVGYDKRFGSWLPHNAPQITDMNMSLDKAKKIISGLFSEFCFQGPKDFTNAVAALMTPFLRGMYSAFNERTPFNVYEANRERAGKDYLAGLTGILYEGHAMEEPPISNNELKSSGSNDELRKKLLAAQIAGRKRLHFANNKGHINNAVLEAFLTNKKNSDRVLGGNDIISLDNEIEVSASGNVGITLTPDLANRSRFIKLFLDIEDANARNFKTPDLHGWLRNNRGVVLSAFYSMMRNWVKKGSLPGIIPFASYPQWASVCGGIMEAAGYSSPCAKDDNLLGIAVDAATADMKALFELCYEAAAGKGLSKSEIKQLIINSESEIFSYINWEDRGSQTKFGVKLNRFVGRVFSDIRMVVVDSSVRSARWEYKFDKIKVEIDKKAIFGVDFEENEIGNLGNLGNVQTVVDYSYKEINNNRGKVTNVTKVTKPKTDREIQFWEAKECKDIKPNHTKQDILDFIKSDPGQNIKTIHNKFGTGSIKFKNELIKSGLVKVSADKFYLAEVKNAS